MANNYTVTGNAINADGDFVFEFIETSGDNVADGNMISSASLTITPVSNYVVQASDFSIGDALPSSVQSVTFADTGIANQPGNTVIATVNLAPSFTVPNSNFTITVDIDGNATFFDEEYIGLDVDTNFELEFDVDSDITTNFTGNGGTTLNEATVSALATVTFSGEATPNKSKSIATITLTAASGFFFNSTPYLKYFGIQQEQLKLVTKTITRDSNKRRTAYSFDLVFKSIIDTSTNSGGKVKLIIDKGTIPQVVKKITRVEYGALQVGPEGGLQTIRIFGTKDAEFNFTITDDTDKKSIIDTNKVASENSRTSNRTTEYSPLYSTRDTYFTKVLNPVYGEIDAIHKKIGSGGVCSYRQQFPAYNSTILTTAINMGGGLSGTTATFDALTNVRIGDRLKMDTISTSDTVTVTALNSSTEAVLSQSVTADDNAVAVFTRDQKYFINLFPLGDTVLGNNLPAEEPHCTINQYMNPVLKLTVSETDGGYTGPTTVFTKTGIANAESYELINTKDYEEGTTALYFPISYSITADGGKSLRAVGATEGTPTWSSTDSSASMWTNSVSANNGGTQIEISNIKTTGLPTGVGGTITITADVNIYKWGTEDVTMNLDLDQIIETH
tara:strand:- start:2317 stop:4167 length:1851 start_codon:yes stop_codon:yes gene_type:complete